MKTILSVKDLDILDEASSLHVTGMVGISNPALMSTSGDNSSYHDQSGHGDHSGHSDKSECHDSSGNCDQSTHDDGGKLY